MVQKVYGTIAGCSHATRFSQFLKTPHSLPSMPGRPGDKELRKRYGKSTRALSSLRLRAGERAANGMANSHFPVAHHDIETRFAAGCATRAKFQSCARLPKCNCREQKPRLLRTQPASEAPVAAVRSSAWRRTRRCRVRLILNALAT